MTRTTLAAIALALATPATAANTATALRRSDPRHSYTVGMN